MSARDIVEAFDFTDGELLSVIAKKDTKSDE